MKQARRPANDQGAPPPALPAAIAFARALARRDAAAIMAGRMPESKATA